MSTKQTTALSAKCFAFIVARSMAFPSGRDHLSGFGQALRLAWLRKLNPNPRTR